jgi:high-affinity nickel-transport protein
MLNIAVTGFLTSLKTSGLRLRLIAIYSGLIGGNLLAWAWAIAALQLQPALLGTALLAYSLGLRHAVDADHIAAIDNVTRKLMQDGQRPASVGLFFSLGHSTVVILASAMLGVTFWQFRRQFDAFHQIGETLGTIVSAGFLLAVAIINVVILAVLWRTFRRVTNGQPYMEEDLNQVLGGPGLLVRVLRPLFGLISQSWHMYPLGLLFGLGFDTATEVGLLGISASQALHGVSIWSILIYPALFTAGMSLVDTTDGVLMLGAYGWAFVKPVRKLYYNIVMTALSVAIAVLVGAAEILGMTIDRFHLKGPLWKSAGAFSDHFGTIGFLIIGLFAGCWMLSVVIYRVRGYNQLDARNRG